MASNRRVKRRVFVGVFLAVAPISGGDNLITIFFIAGLCLMYPKLYFYRERMEALIYRIRDSSK